MLCISLSVVGRRRKIPDLDGQSGQRVRTVLIDETGPPGQSAFFGFSTAGRNFTLNVSGVDDPRGSFFLPAGHRRRNGRRKQQCESAQDGQ
jgi:hypothetical protein